MRGGIEAQPGLGVERRVERSIERGEVSHGSRDRGREHVGTRTLRSGQLGARAALELEPERLELGARVVESELCVRLLGGREPREQLRGGRPRGGDNLRIGPDLLRSSPMGRCGDERSEADCDRSSSAAVTVAAGPRQDLASIPR